MVISDYLRTCGYKVIEATSADEAMTILHHAEIDVTSYSATSRCRDPWMVFSCRSGCAPIAPMSM
jgi:hypothetical protein